MKKYLPTLLILTLAAGAFASSQSPYAGEESRSIKALSQEEVSAYLKGSGMGYAKAAELNGYPGPKHVLELAEELNLTEEQMAQTQALFDQMQAEASQLGAQLVENERELDALFASKSVTPESVQELADSSASIEARIRFTHLNAHLAQKALLSAHQIVRYDELRGYGKGHHSGHHH